MLRRFLPFISALDLRRARIFLGVDVPRTLYCFVIVYYRFLQLRASPTEVSIQRLEAVGVRVVPSRRDSFRNSAVRPFVTSYLDPAPANVRTVYQISFLSQKSGR